jgi:hypothetical protein
MHADPCREPRSPGFKELRLISQWQAKSECGPGFIQGPRLANTRAAPGRGALGNLDSGGVSWSSAAPSVSLHATASLDDGSSGVAVELVESAHAAERTPVLQALARGWGPFCDPWGTSHHEAAIRRAFGGPAN